MIEQLKIIDKIREVALADERISAILMYGSFTQGTGDIYSDVEFYVYQRKGNEVDRKEWISSIHPVEMFFTNEFGTDVVVFDHLIRGEFHFNSVDDIKEIHTWQGILDFAVRDKMNLVDKDGLLTGVLGGIEQLHPDWSTPESIDFVADSMINNLLFVHNVIQRGEYARAEQLFFYLKKYLVLLIRLHVQSTEHWLDPMKELEKDIPSEWVERFRACVPAYEPESLKECFKNTVILTKELFTLVNVPEHDRKILEKITF